MTRQRMMLVSLVVVGSIAAFGVPSSAGGGKPRCFGERATHVYGNDLHDAAGTNGDDVIVSGAFITSGRGGDDLICGTGREFQELYGDGGRDRMNGRGGEDTVDGGDGNDVGKGGDGDDLLAGRSDDDELFGNGGKDKAFGGGGHDHCFAETKRQCED